MKALKLKKIKPLFNQILTTANRYEEDGTIGTLIDATKTAGSYKEYQTVIAVGDSVRSIKAGDVVSINPVKYMRRKYNDNSLREDFVDNPVIEVNIPTIELNGVEHFLIYDNDVSYIIEDYEEEYIPDIPIIKPKKPKLTIPS